MADAAKSDEIEDVLSSIRRLVSEHQPPPRSDAAITQDAAPASPVDDRAETAAAPSPRLLLTPALRVTDPEDPWLPITPRVEEDEEPTAATDDRSRPADIAREDGADWAQELWAEEGASDPQAAAEASDHAPDPQLQADQWEAGNPEPEPDLHSDTAARAAEEDGLETPVDATEALLHEVVEAAAEEADTDAGEGDAADFPDAPLSFIRSTKSVSDYEPEENNDALSGGDLPAPMLELAESRAAHAEPPAAPRVKVEIVRAAAPEKEASPAEAIAEAMSEPTQAPDIAPDDSQRSTADPAGDGGTEHLPPTDSVTDFLAPEPEEPAETTGWNDPLDAIEDLGETPFSFPDDSDGFVDEEALREIISEVVREELQGEMGVRITRNVRKLVRREIRLALAAQDIE